MSHWRDEQQFQHNELTIKVSVEDGGQHARRYISAEGPNADGFFHSAFVDWNVWAGHCHGQLYIPKFLEQATAAHARYLAEQQERGRTRHDEYANLLRQAIPDEQVQSDPHARGFRDALESIALALQATALPSDAVRAVLQTALDAFGNNVDEDGEGSATPSGHQGTVGRERGEVPRAA